MVLGGSLAGLTAAAGLAERFDLITIIESDLLPLVGEHRNGVPQDRHAHILLPGGLRSLAELLPGIVDDLQRHGAHIVDAPEIRFYIAGGRLALERPEPQRTASRPDRCSRQSCGVGFWTCPTFVSSSKPWLKACSSTLTGHT